MNASTLFRLIKDEAPLSISPLDPKDLAQKVIAVHAMPWIRHFSLSLRSKSQMSLTNAAGEPTGHLVGLFKAIAHLASLNIKTLFVFGTDDISEPNTRSVDHMTRCKRESIELIRALGQPVVEAPAVSAKAACVRHVRLNMAHTIATEDIGAIAFGAASVVMNLITNSKYDPQPLQIQADKVTETLGITADQLTDLCILLGCNHAQPPNSVGPAKALALVRAHGSLDAMASITWLHTQQSNSTVYQVAREMLSILPVLPDNQLDIHWQSPDMDAIINIMVRRAQLTEIDVRNGCNKISQVLLQQDIQEQT